jgi:hypothetical protein
LGAQGAGFGDRGEFAGERRHAVRQEVAWVTGVLQFGFFRLSDAVAA